MAIDLRARVYCSLGPLLQGSIADDYLQDTGLVRCRGSVTLNGIFTPDVGTKVSFGYLKANRLARLPRLLRVLSSFADPFAGQTIVQLGCTLTYLQDVQEPVDLDSKDDADGVADVPLEFRRYVPATISAKRLMQFCLDKLDITATSTALTNRYVLERFSFDRPYVEILADLLKSECKFGFMGVTDVLQIRSFNDSSVTGPLLTEERLVEMESIGVGELPGQSVVVPFKSLQLKPPQGNSGSDPTQEERINWERSTSTSGTILVPIQYEATQQVFRGTETTVEETTYGVINNREVPLRKVRTETSFAARKLGNFAAYYLQFGGSLANFGNVPYITTTTTTFEYDDNANEIGSIETTVEPRSGIIGRASLRLGFSSGLFILPTGDATTRTIVREVETKGEYQRVTSTVFAHWVESQAGQQAVAASNETFTDLNQVVSFANEILRAGLVLADFRDETRISGRSTSQARPPQSERLSAAYGKQPQDPTGRYEEKAELALAYGSAENQRYITFTMPYTPDDYVVVVSGTPIVSRSDAKQKALNYGRVQNRLRLGNRSGISVKVTPELVPTEPFQPCYVQAAGFTGQFRVNGCSWSMGPDGLASGVELLFWAGVGQSGGGSAWFPLAPGVSSLPSTPAITTNNSPVPALSTAVPGGFNVTDPNLTTLFNSTLPTTGAAVYPQTMGPSTSVPAYNETVPSIGVVRLTAVATLLPFGPETVTTIGRVRISAVAELLNYCLDAGATSVTLAGAATGYVLERGLVAESRSFWLQSPPLQLFPLRFGADAGSFLLTGQPATLRYYVLSAGSGAFTLTGTGAWEPTIVTGTVSPLLGATAANNYTGWSLVFDGSSDEGATQTATWPFTIKLDSVDYDNCYVNSNTFVTFGGTESVYEDLSATVPALPKIHFGSDDNRYYKVYTKISSAVARIRYEGAYPYSASSANIFVELAFFPATSAGEQFIEMRIGNHAYTSGPFLIANEDTAYASDTLTENSSWVFAGNSTGTSWTLTSNRYVAI